MSANNNQGERVARDGTDWNARAARVLAGGCLTFSKSRRYYVEAQPSHVTGGDGAYLVSPDGKPFLDTVGGLGANLTACDNVYSLPSTLEVEFAERLLERVPFERVKIVKTGTEACMAALRYMRAKRDGNIYSLGYHGWSHEFISQEPNCVGCADTDDVIKLDSIDQVAKCSEYALRDACGVIIEPVQLDVSDEYIAKLRELRRLCTKCRVLLCFDEVITGMRFPKITVAQTYGIMPDLMVMGKAMGGGHPLGLVLGPADIMDREGVFVSGTFAGETSALREGMKLLNRTGELRTYYDAANEFHRKMSYYCGGLMHIAGYGTRMVFSSPQDDGLTVAKYMQEMYTRHRILIGPVMFPKLTWTAREYTAVLEATKDVISNIADVKLVGEKPRPIFKRNT